MFLCDMVLAARLHEIDRRLVQVLTRQRALFVEFLAAVIYVLRRVQRLFRNLRIQFCLLDFFRQTGCSRGFIRGLGLIIGALVFLGGGSQIPVLQNRQQLALAYTAATFHVERFHWRAYFGYECRLLQWKQDRLRGHGTLDRLLFDQSYLHAHRGFLSAGFRAARRKQPEENAYAQPGQQ